MLIKLKNAIRMLVGDELGYAEEGSIQWYYTMAMIIAGLITWKCRPDIANVFMLLSVMHFTTLYIYGSIANEEKNNKPSAIAFLISHLVLTIIALIIDPGVAFLSVIFVIIMICIAWVMTIFAAWKQDSFLPVIFNLIVFITFLICVLILNIKWYEKVIFIILELLIHPTIDYLQKFIPNVLELTDIAWKKTFK